MSISEHLQSIWKELPSNVRLVAVSKFQPIEAMQEAYLVGQHIFGESKAQELVQKEEILPQDIEWHFIGHLQTNKIKYIIPFVSLIHSIDSIKLLEEVNKYATNAGKKVNVLLQIHIAKESSKFGFDETECRNFLSSGLHKSLSNIEICGLMGMATFTDDENLIRSEFRSLSAFFAELKNNFFASNESFKELSMGMSEDYHIAIEEGSTLIRIGSKLFGERNY